MNDNYNLNEKYNIIISKYCLHYIKNLELFFTKANNILLEKGIFIII